MWFFSELLIDGMLSGSLYALISLAFVVVYKASRMINFALGEFILLASKLVATGLNAFGLGVIGSLGFGCAGMGVFAIGLNRWVLRRLIGQPLISFIMVTIGLGIFMRASTVFVFSGIPGSIQLPLKEEPIRLMGLLISPDELITVVVAIVTITTVAWFFQRSRTGVALRAIADDQQAAMLVGIDLNRHFTITWAIAGTICAIAGTLWTFISGGGFSLILVGLKVFPIVIIGGLDSIPGVIIGAIFVGILESLAGGYIDPVLTGFSRVSAYLVLLIILFVR
ncbi:branched-chain amino acid ABC transporter permease, partial [Candidatus Entotheonella palauensis]|uniref:branched-chain amino acid ABC transporter permease n=1 Tax=Candidatus Entotheonella palauensis TaxID=93172 RepID=UPI000B7EE90E